MITITLRRISHRGEACILLLFPYNKTLKYYIQWMLYGTYSQTHRGFYIKEDTRMSIQELIAKLQGLGHLIKLDGNFGNTFRSTPVTKEKLVAIENYKAYLTGLRLSESTIRVYSGFVQDFLGFTEEKPLKELSNDDVRLFVEMIIPRKNYTISTHRQLISGIKHLAYFYPACNIDAETLPRPSKSKKLPIVLSQEEVVDLLRATRNLKHRAIIGLIYSSGLRIGELLHLELRDIEIDRKQLFIRNAKGRKDRYVVLAESVIPLLRNYVISYRPERYFVEGAKGGKYTASSIRKFLKQSCRRANIQKNITPHSLRHSYATHLMENGVGIRHIQELLGHSRPETTMIYTHVAKKDLLDIRSPLDTILFTLSKTDTREENFLLSRNLIQ